MDDAILRIVDQTIAFLRRAAMELRRIAEQAPEVAEDLRRMADQLDADADDLAGRTSGMPRP